MSATMTTRTATTRSADRDLVVGAQPQVEEVQDDVRAVWALVSEVDLRDAVWGLAGPMLTEIATQLRRAIGIVAVSGMAPESPPVVRQRDLAVAARRLLNSEVAIVDGAAANQVRELCTRLSIALA